MRFLQHTECAAVGFVAKAAEPPKWIKPQLTRNVDEAPAGNHWLHEIKYDGYRMHARLEGGKAQLLTRTGLDWTAKYRFTSEALRALSVENGLSRRRTGLSRRRTVCAAP